MDPELKHLVQETLALARDNHRLLRAIRRHQILDTFGKWILWIVIFIATGYSYLVYIQPIIDKLQIPGLSGSPSGSFASTTASFGKLINSFK